MDFIVKPMETDEEIRGKAYVHWKSWTEAYAGLLPGSYLNAPAFRERCEELAFRYRDRILVAKDGDRVIGFAAYGPYRDDSLPDAGEVYAIYVLADYYGQGVGYALMNAAVGMLADCPRIALWVLEGNERAVRFYERYGFRFDGAEAQIVLGEERTERRMIYSRT